ncbi:MAG: arylsulfatase [Planctomycetaceae bacterium]|nr:arylsulfatase [Planctomycetaceae bacterium]
MTAISVPAREIDEFLTPVLSKYASMKTYQHLIAFITLFVAAAFPRTGLSSAQAGDQRPKPDIVFLLIDDLGYADCGFMGGQDIQTPRIDQLAAAGAILESHYVQPVCSPTRAALLTGRYATRTGVYSVVRPHAKWGLPLEERTLANALKDVGYTTAIVGKWHLGEFEPSYLPLARGFDSQYGHFFGMIDNYTHMRGEWHDWYRNDQELREEGYSTHLLTQEACRIISDQDPTRPLFLYVPYNAVHAPLQVPDEYLQPYHQLRGARRQLAGMLAAVDEGIGRIVDALEKAGRRKNTLIVFSSDNGGPPPGTNGPLRGFKGSIWEGGVRGCAFAHWPGKIAAGQRISEPVHIIDWYPTLIKQAGGSLDQVLPIDGRDIWPVLTQQAASPHEEILNIQSPTNAALRVGDWKLIRKTEPATGTKGRRKQAGKMQQTTSLYNLSTDIGESNDLAATEPMRVQAMTKRLNEILKDAVPPGQE